MEATAVFNQFIQELHTSFPESIPEKIEFDVDKVVEQIENEFFPLTIKIVQKDGSFFDESRVLFGINLSEFWKASEGHREMIWKNLVICIFASFLHGDIKEKFNKILNVAKSMWSESGQENDEISRVLNDEKSEGYLKEIFDFVMETRLAKMFMNFVESFDISEYDINFENPLELIEMLKNQEHPTLKKIVGKVQSVIEDKIRRGELSQQLIQSEVEAIKAKVMSLFGNVFNEALGGGRRNDISPQTFIANTPEARRQRMLARLQRKVRDKNSK